jgi:hypothetical protein
MLKQISQLEHKTENKTYHFLCDQDSPLNEVKDALFQFLKYVGQVEDAAKAQQEALKAQEAAKPQVEEEMPSEENS